MNTQVFWGENDCFLAEFEEIIMNLIRAAEEGIGMSVRGDIRILRAKMPDSVVQADALVSQINAGFTEFANHELGAFLLKLFFKAFFIILGDK